METWSQLCLDGLEEMMGRRGAETRTENLFQGR